MSPRDRSLVTVAAVIARNQTVLLPEQLELALKNGVKPAELSETITQLAFYAGWGNAIAAAAVTKEIFLQKELTLNSFLARRRRCCRSMKKLKQLALHA